MEKISIENYEFITEDLGTAVVVFSTAKNGLNFYSRAGDGKENIEKLKAWFPVKEVAYLSQIHSDIVYTDDCKGCEGDAIITDKPGVAVGVFTADCVPVIIYDPVQKAAAAVHSGWKGTYSLIVSKTIDKMKTAYGSVPTDMKVLIGPNMRECCYEVSEELIQKFRKSDYYKDADTFRGRKLSMEKCILRQLENQGVPDENIEVTGLCTSCNKAELYSYRGGEKDKRLFSFIYIK
jgi:YfiH family protein